MSSGSVVLIHFVQHGLDEIYCRIHLELIVIQCDIVLWCSSDSYFVILSSSLDLWVKKQTINRSYYLSHISVLDKLVWHKSKLAMILLLSSPSREKRKISWSTCTELSESSSACLGSHLSGNFMSCDRILKSRWCMRHENGSTKRGFTIYWPEPQLGSGLPNNSMLGPESCIFVMKQLKPAF